MPKALDSCVSPARGPLVTSEPRSPGSEPVAKNEEEVQMIARVGKPAPDFEASAFVDGGFRNISLSEYKGKWVVLCFYPGDFTFV